MTTSQINPNQLRPNGDDGDAEIIRVGPERRYEAIGRLLSSGGTADREQARRFIEHAHQCRINLEQLWSRVDALGRIVATTLIVPSPGRTAMVFASHPTSRRDLRGLAGLIDRACRDLGSQDIHLAQALLEPSEALDREMYRLAGFMDLAVLSYLERPLRIARSESSLHQGWPEGVIAVPYRESMRHEMVEVLDQTYIDTLDCPGLRGQRHTADILDGHQASGRFDPNLWTILRHNGRSVGALLLNPSADRHSIELVYLGLAPPARGHGLGRQLLRYGFHLVQNRSEQVMNLAVDESNTPALNLYLREGFKTALRRRAMIRPIAQ